MSKLYVIGIGFRPLSDRASEIVLNSQELIASNRLLEVFKFYKEYEAVKDRIVINQSIVDLLDYVHKHRHNKRLCLLASGDPMFFGIGRRLATEIPASELEIIPDLSSVQVAFNRINEAWDDAFMISLHGGPVPDIRRKLEYEPSEIAHLLRLHQKLAILTDNVNNPTVIAKHLLNVRGISITVCERLGYPDERVLTDTPQVISKMEFKDPNVVIIRQMKEALSRGILFTEANFKHKKGMITKDEIRAVVIQQLSLQGARVLWDIGAGSGAISIEAGQSYPHLKVYAVEKDPEMAEIINENIAYFEATNVNVSLGDALAVSLPTPERVFVGGSTGRLAEIIELIHAKMPKGIVVLTAVKLETLHLAVEALQRYGFEVNVSQVLASRLVQLSRLEAINPVFVIRGIRL